MRREKQDIILADCKQEELEDFVAGLNKTLGTDIKIYSKIANSRHTKFYNIYRYFIYATFPIKFFLNRKEYRYIICWQQFYALFLCAMCRFFKVENTNYIIACNYTYKPKRLLSKIYYNFFKNNSRSKYMYKIHVPSYDYTKKCIEDFKMKEDKFVVVPFGLPDSYEMWKGAVCSKIKIGMGGGKS